MFALLLTLSFGGDLEEEKYGVKYASTCEVCKVWILCPFPLSYIRPQIDLISTSNFRYVKCDCNVLSIDLKSKVVAIEFGSKLSESQKSHGGIETGYSHTRLQSSTFEISNHS